MAGINRLGKGPAKPGIARPQDPNKYKTMNIFSEDTGADKDYQRMVQDIEDQHQQNHMGWLFSRGAFDKGDSLYLRDQEEKKRYEEQELRESELRSFARMRQKAEAARDSGPAPGAQPPQPEARSQGLALQTRVRIKPAARAKRKQEPGAADAKRVKPDPDQPAAVKAEPALVKEEPGAGAAAGADGGLGLLGGYGSDSEGDALAEQPTAEDGGAAPAQPPQPTGRALPLPDIQVRGAVKLEPGPPAAAQPGPAAAAAELQLEDSGSEEADFSD